MIGRRMAGSFVLVVAMATAPGLTVAQQTRDGRAPAAAPAAAPQPTGTGALGGAVTNDDGSRPVRSAVVLLIGITTGAVRVSSTDTDGRFLFPGLPADRYIVGASKPPYLSMIAGARRPAKSGTPIVLADAQKLTNVAIRLPMSAAITGLVLDEKGQPAASVQIGVSQWRLQNGERTPVFAGSTNTDDRGRYRLFGLAPGEYLVAAAKQGSPPIARALTASDVDAALRAGTAPLTPPVPTDLRYAAVFFPGTTRAGDATAIAVSAGEERENVDFKLEITRAVRVAGSVAVSEGQLPQRLVVSLTTLGGLIRSVSNAVVQPDGSFAFSNVLAGRYVLTANAGGQPPQIAMATLDVNGVDVNGVQLVLGAGAKVAGTLAFRGSARPPALAGWRVSVRTLGPAGTPGPVGQDTDESGAFTLANVYPGAYVIGGGPQPFGPTSDTVTWTIESVVVDGRDVTDLPTEISAGSPRNLVVTYTDRSQELTGRIMSATGTPAPEYTVVIFPEDKAYWISGSRRILTARPGTDGKFVLSAPGPNTLPPGRYLLAAVTDLDRDEQYDPSFLNALIPGAVPVTLQPGEKKVQDLRVK